MRTFMIMLALAVALQVGLPLSPLYAAPQDEPETEEVTPVEEAASEEPVTEEAVPVEEASADESAPAESLVFMSAVWAEDACDAWNESEVLTQELDGWIENDLDRGYKVMQIYRLDCEESPRIEMRIAMEEELVKCIYGGAVKAEELDPDADYLMFAMTERWQEMGAGEYGPFKAMMTSRLKFSGPKWEAMKNMGPFGSFLELAGSVPGDTEICPE